MYLILKVYNQPFFSSLDVRDDHIRYYTGLPSSAVFTKLFTMLNDVFLAENDGFCSSLAPKKQFLMVLMKLRHAFKHQDLAYRFQVAVTQVSLLDKYYVKRIAVFNSLARQRDCSPIFARMFQAYLYMSNMHYRLL